MQLEPQRVSLLHCAGDDNAQRDEHAPAQQQQPEVGLQGRGLGGMGVVLLHGLPTKHRPDQRAQTMQPMDQHFP